MGAGQIGGIAALLDIDFNNAAGFIGTRAEVIEAQYIVHFLSHAMLFCAGVLIEPHVVLTPAICVFGEKYKFQVFAGTHRFLENAGVSRDVQNMCIHKGYNHTLRWEGCSSDNIALLVLNSPFSLRRREPGSEYVINRVRYGYVESALQASKNPRCRYYGWGSRRNGYLIPLLIDLRRVNVKVLPKDECTRNTIWNTDNKYLCLEQPPCRSETHGALCPDDLGSVIVCSGFIQGMMISRLVDRPCGVGFVDLNQHNKFLTCGVDDSRDVINDEVPMEFEYATTSLPITPSLITPPPEETNHDNKFM